VYNEAQILLTSTHWQYF